MLEAIAWEKELYLRFKPNDIGHPVHFIPNGRADLPDAVKKLHASRPLLRGQLDFSSKLMDVFDEGGKDNTISRSAVGSNRVDYILSEVGVKSALGGHFSRCMNSWRESQRR